MAAFLAALSLRYRLAKARMRKLGATSEETAKSPKELGIEEWMLRKLAEGWGVRQTSNGRFYVECEDGKHSKGL